MGTIDDARAAAGGFRQASDQAMVLLQTAGETVATAQAAFAARMGPTRHPQVVELEARCQVTRAKVAEALQALDAARRAADEFRASLA